MTEQVQEIPEKPAQPEIVPEMQPQRNPFKVVLLVVLGLITLAGAVYAGVIIGKKLNPPEVIPQVIETSPTPDGTADWETYTNIKHNYSFSYPKNYFLTAERLDGYDDIVVLHKLTEDALKAYGENLNRLTVLSEEGLIWNLVLTKPRVGDLSLRIPKTCIKKNNSGGYLYYSCPDVFPPEPEIGKENNAGAEFYVIGEQEVSGPNKMIFPMYLTRRNPPLQSGKFSNEEIKEIESIIDTFKFFPDVDETANWKTYQDLELNFKIKYPSNIDLVTKLYPEKIDGKSFNSIQLNKGQIIISISKQNPEDCRGDCPVIEQAEDYTLSGIKGRKLFGYIGEIGGNVPESYQYVVIPHNSLFYLFYLHELNNDYVYKNKDGFRSPAPIPPKDIQLFDQILSTFKFLD